MMEVVLRLRMPESWVQDVGGEGSIRFLDCMPYGDEGGRSLICIPGDEGERERLMDDIRSHPDVCRVEFARDVDGNVLGSVTTQRCVACRALTGSDCFLASAMSMGDHVEWKLITGGEGSLKRLIERLRSDGCGVELVKTTKLSRKSALTERQETILRAAYEKGYYDYPKKTTIKELASGFDISPSTLAEILQRGERKVMERHFRG